MARIVVKARKDKTIKLKTLVILGVILFILFLAAIWALIFGRSTLAKAYMRNSINSARLTMEKGISEISRDKAYQRYLMNRFDGVVVVPVQAEGYGSASGGIAKRLIPGFFLDAGVMGQVTWDMNCWNKFGDPDCVLARIEMAHCATGLRAWREWRRRGVDSGMGRFELGKDSLGCEGGARIDAGESSTPKSEGSLSKEDLKEKKSNAHQHQKSR